MLTDLGMDVRWKECKGAEEEGHWLKEPEQLDNSAEFLKNNSIMLQTPGNNHVLILHISRNSHTHGTPQYLISREALQ